VRTNKETVPYHLLANTSIRNQKEESILCRTASNAFNERLWQRLGLASWRRRSSAGSAGDALTSPQAGVFGFGMDRIAEELDHSLQQVLTAEPV
jgi:hypothetical protein